MVMHGISGALKHRRIIMENSFKKYNDMRMGVRTPELEKELDKDAKDEQEAIEGYDKTLKEIKDKNTREQVKKIRKEEIAHKKYLEEAKNNPNAKYHDPQ